jgi:hypothetical protein
MIVKSYALRIVSNLLVGIFDSTGLLPEGWHGTGKDAIESSAD